MRRSSARKYGWYCGALLALAAVVIAVSSAQAAPAQKKTYTILISPGLAAPGSTGSFTLTLTNSGGSQALGSANIAVPSGFTVSIPAPTSGWSVTATSPQVIMWRAPSSASAIQPGANSQVTLSVGAGMSGFACSTNPWTWTSAVKQSNDFSGTGNDFTLQPGTADASLTVAKLVFTTQPSQTLVSTSIAPAVQVTLRDLCGSTLGSVAGDVTLSIGTNPSGGTLTGGTPPVSLSAGTATFSALKIDTSGVGYTLIATPGSSLNIDPSVSTSFNVIDALCTHSGGLPSCTTSNTGKDTTVSVPVPSDSAQTALSVGKPSQTLTDCTTGTLTQVGSIATIAPTNYPPGATISVTLKYAASVATTPGTSSYVVCVKLSDGSFVQALPCNKSAPPCVSNRSRDGTGALIIVLTINATDPGGVTYG